MSRRPPSSTRTDTLFPYTTLFRSGGLSGRRGVPVRQPWRRHRRRQRPGVRLVADPGGSGQAGDPGRGSWHRQRVRRDRAHSALGRGCVQRRRGVAGPEGWRPHARIRRTSAACRLPRRAGHRGRHRRSGRSQRERQVSNSNHAPAAEPGAICDQALRGAGGHFGRHGGRFGAETLIGPLEELAAAYEAARVDPAVVEALDKALAHYVGRPSPIYEAARLSEHVGGARILLKREDLNHTGAHKINNTIGQALLASRMGKTRIIAETGAGQHGVASATVAARLGLECVVYMGATDIERQKINVYRMQLLGARVVPVTSGSAPPQPALNDAKDARAPYGRDD